MSKRLFLIVLDSLGVGALPDAAKFGDEGSNTLMSLTKSHKLHVPNLTRFGIFNIDGLDYSGKAKNPCAVYGRMAEQSAAKDTTTGHWELAGLITKIAPPTYPQGFPAELLDELSRLVGRGFLCNLPYSGTQVLTDYGQEHMETGKLIVYTSADSVLQIAAHEDVVPLEELYRICETARRFMMPPHQVGRIIARPFEGQYPNFQRTTNRHDYALEPPGTTMLDQLSQNGINVWSVGKIYDIFAGKSIHKSFPTKGNDDGMNRTMEIVGQDFSGLCFVNLVDFDMLYGHRNDVDGYANALTEFDLQLGQLLEHLREDDMLILTADHGCDPSTPSTDHSREYIPILLYGKSLKAGINLGTRDSFADLAATVQQYFGLPIATSGTSFLSDIML